MSLVLRYIYNNIVKENLVFIDCHSYWYKNASASIEEIELKEDDNVTRYNILGQKLIGDVLGEIVVQTTLIFKSSQLFWYQN